MKTTIRIAMILWVSFGSLAQVPATSGEIAGVVRDEAGLPLPGVAVTAKGPAGTTKTVIMLKVGE